MKLITLTFFTAFLAIATGTFAHHLHISSCIATASPGVYLYNVVELPAGTLVHFDMVEMVESGKATIGQVVNFRVHTNVEIDGKIVVRSGAAAVGRVKWIEPTSFNHPEEITLEVTAVQPVEGPMIEVNGQEQTFKGRLPNEQVIAYPGRGFTGYTVNNTKFSL